MYLDVLSLFISVGATIVSAVSAIFSYNISKKEALATQGSLELQIRASINEAYYNMTRFGMLVAEKPEDDTLCNAFKGAEEIYRNAYEDACDKYRQGKVNKESFRRMYQIEIRRLVEEKPYRAYYEDNQSPYINTLNVYREWHRS